MKTRLLVALTTLLAALACNASALPERVATANQGVFASVTATIEGQVNSGEPPGGDAPASEGEPSGVQAEAAPEIPGSAQTTECITGVQYQAEPFGDEATWAAYQAHIDRDVSTLNAFWAGAYPELAGGAAYPGVCSVVEYDPQSAPYLAECGLDEQTAAQNAFYCSTVNAVMWDGPNFYHPIYQELGDAAVTFITAHEFGHAAQFLSGQVPRRSVNTELQADCFAGAYLQYMNEQGLMSEGDAEEVIAIVYAVGQSRVGTRWLERTHGTPVQREIAMRRGFTQGVAGCQADFEELTGARRDVTRDFPFRVLQGISSRRQ